MTHRSRIGRLVIGGVVLCLVSSLLAGCMAGAAISVVSQGVKTTTKAAGTAARITMDGARVVSHTLTKPFRGDDRRASLAK